MNIKQEDFDNLNQLDRIEYRMVAKEIKEDNKSNCVSFFAPAIILGFIIYLSYVVLISQYNLELTKILLLIFKQKLIPFSCIIIGLSLLADLYNSYRRKKLLNELDSKYFKHEVKKRK